MITVREITDVDSGYWNKEIQQFKCAHPLNAFEWGVVRSVDGWRPIYLCAERDGKLVAALMMLAKRLPFTPFVIMYAQKMPVWSLGDDEALDAVLKAAKQIGKRENAVFLRINPNITEGVEAKGKEYTFLAHGFLHLKQRWTFWNSPRDVARIDLTAGQTPDELFCRLDKDARYSIRKALRGKATIEPATSKKELREFYDLFLEFSRERGFMARSYAYQEKLWDTYLENGMGRLLLAKHQGKIVSGYLCLLFARKCLFLHMATPARFRKLHSDDANVWACIAWAKENGCVWFSFRGVGTTPTQEAFKRKFKAQVVSLIGYYDMPFKPILYRISYWLEFTLLPAAYPWLIRTRRLVLLLQQGIRRLKGIELRGLAH
jgi:lipid II:glycine glycyltransferase (peptidoglycan interpeptide bridge formation enzyme)